MKEERIEGKPQIVEVKKEKLVKREVKKALKPREKPISDNERKIKKNKTEDILKDKEKKLKDESKVKVKRKSSEGAGLNTTPSAKAKTKETKEKSTQGNESPTKKKVKKPYSSDDKLFPEARLDASSILRMNSIRRASQDLVNQIHASSPKNSPKNSPKSSPKSSPITETRPDIVPITRTKPPIVPRVKSLPPPQEKNLTYPGKPSENLEISNPTNRYSLQSIQVSESQSSVNAHNFDYYAHRSLTIEKDENSAGWEEYIKNIMKAGCVSHAAIIGEHNTIWAASKNLNLSYEEVINLRKGFEKNGSFFSSGITLEGVKYFALRSDENCAYGKKGPSGCVCVKTKRTILVGLYSYMTHSASATELIEKIAAGLVANNF